MKGKIETKRWRQDIIEKSTIKDLHTAKSRQDLLSSSIELQRSYRQKSDGQTEIGQEKRKHETKIRLKLECVSIPTIYPGRVRDRVAK